MYNIILKDIKIQHFSTFDTSLNKRNQFLLTCYLKGNNYSLFVFYFFALTFVYLILKVGSSVIKLKDLKTIHSLI